METMNWSEHQDIYTFIEDNWMGSNDYTLSSIIKESYNMEINPETIRNLRRKEGWIKNVSTSVESSHKFEKVVFVGDFHIPFHDYKLFELFIQFIKYFKPDKCYIS